MENFALFLTFLLSAIAEISAAAIVCSVLCLSSGAKSQISHSASAKTTEGIDRFIYASLESKLRFSSFVCFGVNKLLEQGNWSLLPRNALIFHLLWYWRRWWGCLTFTDFMEGAFRPKQIWLEIFQLVRLVNCKIPGSNPVGGKTNITLKSESSVNRVWFSNAIK